MSTPKADIKQSAPRPSVIPDRLPLHPTTAGPRRNGMPELKRYEYGTAVPLPAFSAPENGPVWPAAAPAAEDYQCPGCGGGAKVVDGVVRPSHGDPECPVGKRAAALRAKAAS
jgi:hypothetical protein